MPKVKGKSMWAFLTTADTKYDPCWRIAVIISADEARKLHELGIRYSRTDEIKNPEEAAMGPYKVTLRRYCEKRGKAKGQPNDPPILVDVDEAPFTQILGNGSEVIVEFDTYSWSYTDKKTKQQNSGTSADLKKVKVVELVEYVPKETTEDSNESSTTEDDF